MRAIRLPNTKAFTLVELLVVVAIITLLIALLVPALSAAKKRSQLVYCGSNLRSYGTMLTFYANDNSEIIPLAYLYGVPGNTFLLHPGSWGTNFKLNPSDPTDTSDCGFTLPGRMVITYAQSAKSLYCPLQTDAHFQPNTPVNPFRPKYSLDWNSGYGLRPGANSSPNGNGTIIYVSGNLLPKLHDLPNGTALASDIIYTPGNVWDNAFLNGHILESSNVYYADGSVILVPWQSYQNHYYAAWPGCPWPLTDSPLAPIAYPNWRSPGSPLSTYEDFDNAH